MIISILLSLVEFSCCIVLHRMDAGAKRKREDVTKMVGIA